MADERQKRILAVLEDAVALAPERRPALLDERCDGDARLRSDVERLLATLGAEDTEEFMEAPAFSFDPNVGRRIGPYELVRRLDRGGMGAVYLARRRDPKKTVALKLVQQGMNRPEILQRFFNERQILAELLHSNIATFLDGGATDDGEPYFVMEYIEGEPIDHYCETKGLSLPARLELFRKVCTAVGFAHQLPVVHRDLKPDNILVTAEGEPKLLDFGIAKLLDDSLARSGLTEEGRGPMTRLYASPEQVRGEPVKTTSDVYSLGVVLYKVLTGCHPYRFESGEELEQAICEQTPEKPSSAVLLPDKDKISGGPPLARSRLSEDVDSIVLKALRKEPDQRFGSVGELSEDLRRYLEGWPVKARQGSVLYTTSKFFRRHKLALFVSAGIVLLILAFSVVSTLLWMQAVRDREQAELERRRAEEATVFLKNLFRGADPNASAGEALTARELLERGRARLASELGDEPELRIDLAGTLGEIYRNLGAFDDSRQLMEESLQLARRYYTEDHPELAKRIVNLGVLLYDHGDEVSAEGLFREALAMHQRLRLDESHSFRVKDNLATILMLQSELVEAEKLYLSVFEERKRRYGSEDRDVGTSLRSLGALYYLRGDFDRAESRLRQSLTIRRRYYGGDHTQVASVLDLLGRVVTARGDRQEAKKLLDEALRIRRQLLGEDHVMVAQTKKSLAALLASEDPAKAAELARESLEVLRLSKPGTWELADARSVFGACLTELGSYAEAETYLVESYTSLSALRGDDTVYSRTALERLVTLYDRWGKPAELERYRNLIEAREQGPDPAP